MKFSEIPYERVDLKAVKKKLVSLEKAYRNAKTYEEAKKIDAEIQNYMAAELYQAMSFVHIKNTIDMSDKFYEEEVKYYNSKIAMFLGVNRQYNKDFLNSPFKEEYLKDGKSIRVKLAEVEVRQQTLKTALLKIQESNLQLEYSKKTAQVHTTFHGKDMNFYGLLKEMQDPDREVRKEALTAWSNLYESISGDLDAIYDKMIANRVKQAKKLKYTDYVEQIYDARSIFDYDRHDAKKFKDAVVKYVVPACQKLHDEQAKRLGVDHLYYYDEGLFYPEGALVPQGTTEELIAKANEMYHEMSKETGEFFQFMSDNGYFDLETKPNKRGGGYCSALPKYRAPFIFSNFNGTSADVDVLTHEAGHAFAAFTGFKDPENPFDQNNMTMDIAEIHSMTMEFFAYPWMDKFFGEKADAYRFYHFEEALLTIPYLCAVDEFQHRVFANPSCTAKERRAIWKDIEKTFLPWRDYGDLPFLAEGGFWMQKQHIFLFPFYYLDYALAQMCAFQFNKRDVEGDHAGAWGNYYKLCQIAGKQGYLETLSSVELNSPFKEETIQSVVEFVMKRSEELKSKLVNVNE